MIYMSKYILLKSEFGLLVLEIPEKFCKDYQILQVDDESILNELIERELKADPRLSLTRCYSEKELAVPKARFVSLKQGDFYKVFKQEEILYVVASGSYSFVTMQNQEKITVTFNLAEVEPKLSEGLFVRIHRSVIVNVNYITKFIGNTLYVGKKDFPIGRTFKKAFIDRMNVVCGSKRPAMEECEDN